MTDKDTGGPAFPYLRRYVAPDTYEPLAEGGMTLRDWFAGQAITAAGLQRFDDEFSPDHNASRAAAMAYAIADAMIAARSE